MSDSPADGVMTVPTPPGYGGDFGAVNTPAPVFSTRSHSYGQAVPGYSLELEPLPCPCANTHRHEQRAAEQEQRVGERWTTTGKADADYGSMGWRKTHEADAVPTRSDAAKPTYKRSPWWRWT